MLLQLDLVPDFELADEVRHIAHARAAKAIDALVVVAHGNHAGSRLVAPAHIVARQLLEPLVLQLVGVLELVHQDMLEAALVMVAQMGIVTQQLVAAQHQLAEIDHTFSLALLLVELVDLDLFAGVRISGHDIAGAHALFLAARDEVHQLLGRKALVIDIELLAQALDGRELILGVQNLERLRQLRGLIVGAQQTVAQAVKRAYPHAAHVVGQHGRQAREHLLGGLVGEGHGHDGAGRGLPGLQQPGNARGQHARLARAGTRQNQRMARRQGHCGQLLIVEAGQQGRVRGEVGAGICTVWRGVKQVDREHSPPL
ncbi:hypothetical protein SDC9_108855 [bioreactor metagenome]|uniref:Uncharacterized protein n=1 Tax=bioreactor metagenome TaxID=1076179 RepID=A0A645B950_9ZZZZ